MTREEAERLLVLSREADWAFPSSSSGSILVKPGRDAWVDRLLPERDAFAGAARFFVESGDEDAAAEIAANVWRLWLMASDVPGGRAFLATALDSGHGKPSRWRALALYGDGFLALRQGRLEESRARNEEALDAARASGDPGAEALALLGLARLALFDGDHEQARSLARGAIDLTRDLDPAMGQAPLHMLAQGTRMSGDYDGAATLFTQSLELNRRIEDPGMVAVELHNLGYVELHRGNVDAAESCFAELGPADDPYGQAMAHLNQAALAFARGDRDRAADLLSCAQTMFEETGAALSPDDAFEVEWLSQQLG